MTPFRVTVPTKANEARLAPDRAQGQRDLVIRRIERLPGVGEVVRDAGLTVEGG